MVCAGFVVTEVGVAVIVRVQSTELSGVERFVRRLLTDWGPGPARVGGVALLGSPLPRSRRRSAPATDLLVWTPHGCTLVVLADFGSVQHGVLTTGPTGRWQVGESAADLRTGRSTPNPLLRGRKLRNELSAMFRRHGLSEQLDVLVVLIPKTGSRISWTPRPPEDGIETILVRIGSSAGLTAHFERSSVGEVRWRGADIARAFEILGVPRHLPDPGELAKEGFVLAPGSVADLRTAGDESSGPPVEPAGSHPLIALSGRSVRLPGPRIEAPTEMPAAVVERDARPPSTAIGSGPYSAIGSGSAGSVTATETDAQGTTDSDVRAETRGSDADNGPERVGGARGGTEAESREGTGPSEWETGAARGEPAVGQAASRESGGSRADAVAASGPPVRPAPSAPNRRDSDGRAAPDSDREHRVAAGARAGVLRGLAGAREIPARVRRAAASPRPAAPPPGEAHNYGRPERRGRDLRYRAALGLSGVALAAVTATVFAASGFARFDVTEYGALCGGGEGNPAAAPYSGAGPSPIYLGGDLPEYTAFGPSAVWRPIDPGAVQLVACVAQERRGELVRTCQYPPAPGQPVGRTLNLFTAVYRLTVYEARTANQLAAMAITGDQFGADPAIAEPDPCRAATGTPEDGLPGRRHSRPSQQQIEQALTPFVAPASQLIRAAR
ncbi:hypothetical protein GCM10011588_35650 [Nocardia jinanensis]|uniref:NERD domain-containing protein n=2 Tax=Nocardia jinanensis TaxID=382504 RepID=A0A917RPK7_9NOCA|nr:hypothetical protein GCM10011588_35650 [Nocardia jinanensis]